MNQPIYTKIDNEFRSFVANNEKVLRELEAECPLRVDILHGVKGVCRSDMLDEPYNIAFIYKIGGDEGSAYHFLDKHMDKIYSYYEYL